MISIFLPYQNDIKMECPRAAIATGWCIRPKSTEFENKFNRSCDKEYLRKAVFHAQIH